MTGEVENKEDSTSTPAKPHSVAGTGAEFGSNESARERVFGVEALWRIQIKSIRDQIISGAKDYLEVANLAEHIGADYHGRFLIELIQNAEDPSRQTTYSASGQRSTRLIIVRTETAVAVLNQGTPFTEKDIRSITSLGLSTKNPETSLGNKGVGFKAVFQVTDSPEIYSAPRPGGNLWAEDANRFCMQEKPFSDDGFVQAITGIVEEELSRDPARATVLSKLAGGENPTPYLIAELMRAAPFKFPKPLSLKDQQQRTDELGLTRETVRKMSTMVVLPLLDRPTTTETIDAALDELTRSEHPSSTLLFLEGIGRLWIFDRMKGSKVLLLRNESGKAYLERGIEIRDVTTVQRIQSRMGRERRKARWWLATRRFGRDGSDPTTSSEEERCIAEAVKDLRIGTWKDVRSAYVGVALPRSPYLGENLRPLGVDGMFCIGLPTHVRTAMPTWVNGPFHGHISRTFVDFKDQQYNRLILDEGIAIFWSTLEYIKTLSDADDRRHVALALERDDGPYQSGIAEYRNLSLQEVVLDFEGSAYVAPSALKVPSKDDIGTFDRTFAAIDGIERFGFCLPDHVLLTNCWELLDSLAGNTEIVVDDSVYLHRSKERASLLETTALAHRRDGREWWEKFLEWVVARFQFSDLQEQRILPIGGDALAAAIDRVFFRPLMAVVSGENSRQQDESTETPALEEIIDDLDDAFLDELAFLDETCVQVRQQDGQRPFTDLARKLSPEQGAVLVRNPRRPEIINEVLAPYLSSVCVVPEERIRALAVLAQIADWIHDMMPNPRGLVDFSGIRVPVVGDDGQWDWVAPIEVYFGDGWLGPEVDRLVEKAYGAGDSFRLPTLASFQHRSGADVARDGWHLRFREVGVRDAPRLITMRTGRRVYLKANWYNKLTIDHSHECPIPKASRYWQQYLSYLATRSTEVKTGQPYYVRHPCWVDGLERDSARYAVFRLVLQSAESFSASIHVSVERERGADAHTMSSLWVHAIETQQWPIIPTNIGPCAPSKTWRLNAEMRRTLFARDGLLPFVKPPYDQAVSILRAVGVYSPTDAPVWRIVAELQDVAKSLASLESSRRSTEALIRELYTWLQEATARSSTPESDLQTITERPVPLLKNGEFVIVDLSIDAIVLLNDDSERLPYVKDASAAFVLPLYARQSNVALYEALREVLGSDRVMRASEAAIVLDFMQTDPDTPLLDYLLKSLEPKRSDIRRDLAALIAFGGKTFMDPRKETFREKWAQFHDTRIRHGHFNNADQTSAIFDQRAVGGPALYVPYEHGPVQILQTCWHLLGPSHQHAWENYVTRFKADECDKFFERIHLNDRDWIELDSVMGASKSSQLHRLQPIFLALRRHQESDMLAEQFRIKLEDLDLDLNAIAAWLGIERMVLEKVLADGSLIFDDERQLTIIETLGVSVPDWQCARRDLGRNPVTFLSTIRSFEDWRASIVAYLRTMIARDVSDQSLLDEASHILENMSEITCPHSLAEQQFDQTNIASRVMRVLRASIDEETKTGTLIARRSVAIESIKEVDGLSGPRTPRRELTLYRHLSEYQRESDATEAVSDVLRVARALADHHGETIDVEDVLSDAAIMPWLQGYWANCFAALRALREVLLTITPTTGKKLNDAGVFALRQRDSWRELWKRFPELGELPTQNQTAPQEPVEILGEQILENELESILGQGSDGALGQRLVDAVDEEIDMAALAMKPRDSIMRPKPTNKGRRVGSGRRVYEGGGRKPDQQAGWLGEAFVYESLRNTLPDFDVACWVSDSRKKYGIDGKGDDGLGYDFEYTDVEGKLTGATNQQHCLIEVKSTTSIYDEPFHMTTNEWAVAGECYKGIRKAQYVIVRVLDVKRAPVIADVVIDPVRLWLKGKLALENRDFIVRTGLRNQ